MTSEAPAPAPAAEPAPPAPTTSAPVVPDAPTGEPTAAELAGFISDYYAALPGGTAQGWDQLTPRFQNGIARNRDYYESFWGSIEVVDVADVSASPPGRVEATLTYRFKDGRVSVERTVYSVVRDGGGLKIDDSAVVGG